jgi:hypothetical protein
LGRLDNSFVGLSLTSKINDVRGRSNYIVAEAAVPLRVHQATIAVNSDELVGTSDVMKVGMFAVVDGGVGFPDFLQDGHTEWQ